MTEEVKLKGEAKQLDDLARDRRRSREMRRLRAIFNGKLTRRNLPLIKGWTTQ